MKKLIIALTVLAFSAGLVGVAYTDGFKTIGSAGLPGTSAGKMTWRIGATTDSVAIMLPWSDNANVSAAAETTGTFDVRGYVFPKWGAATDDLPLIGASVWFSGDGGLTTSVAGDSIQVIPMYSWDGVLWHDGTTTYAIGVSPIDIQIVAESPTVGNGFGAGLWRFRCNNYTQDSQPRQVYIKPYIFVAKNAE